MNLDLSKMSGPDYIPVVVLKNCEPELLHILAELFNMCLKESYFPEYWQVTSVFPVFQNVGKRSTAKNYCPVSLLSVFSTVFEKLVNHLFIEKFTQGNVAFCLISSMVLGLPDQLQIFRQVCLIELLGHLIYPRLLTEFGMLHKISTQIFDLISSFLDNRWFWWFWMGNLPKNIQLMLEFFNAPFLVLHFSYYTFMTFLIILSVILLSMLMILLSTLNVIRNLICGNN